MLDTWCSYDLATPGAHCVGVRRAAGRRVDAYSHRAAAVCGQCRPGDAQPDAISELMLRLKACFECVRFRLLRTLPEVVEKYAIAS
jgi:hypothetical protein